MPIEPTAEDNAAWLCDALRERPDVDAVYGPMQHIPGRIFLRFELRSGESFAIELNAEHGE